MTTASTPKVADSIILRTPRLADAASIDELVRSSGVLEPNSCYGYLLMCRDFSQTCVVAELGPDLAGFVIGYVPPAKPDTLFVWQIGVDAAARRQGLANRMLTELFEREGNRKLRFLEATIAPSNLPSRKMFERFAKRCETDFEYTDCFRALDFGGAAHEEEPQIRIGPITRD